MELDKPTPLQKSQFLFSETPVSNYIFFLSKSIGNFQLPEVRKPDHLANRDTSSWLSEAIHLL